MRKRKSQEREREIAKKEKLEMQRDREEEAECQKYGESTEIERKRVEIEGGIEEGSWRFRRKKTTFRDKLKNGIRSDDFGGK